MWKKNRFFFLVVGFLFGFLHAEETPPVTPQVVESQLEKAERDFREAKKMFDPWYAGPLITGSAHILPAGQANIQPYLYYIDNYAHYDSHGKSHDIHDLQQVNPVAILQVGVFDEWIDSIFTMQGLYNKQQHHSIMNIGDTNLSFRLRLLTESAYHPAILIGLKEIFPTGKFNHLSPHKGGIDGTGNGSWTSLVVFNISKVVWWVTTHPMNLRLSLSYGFFSSHVSVRNFNTYGGGYGTHGKVHPGNSFSGDFGYEYSLTQRWVAALDFAYTYASKTTFSGTRGVDETGMAATVGGPLSDQLSLAPALEYNLSPNLGFVGGVWFSVYGRNSANFVSGVITTSYTF